MKYFFKVILPITMNFHLTVKQPPKIIPKTKVYSAKPHWKETLQLLLINF